MPLHSLAVGSYYSQPANAPLANCYSKFHWRILFAYSTAANTAINYFFAVLLLRMLLLMRTDIF